MTGFFAFVSGIFCQADVVFLVFGHAETCPGQPEIDFVYRFRTRYGFLIRKFHASSQRNIAGMRALLIARRIFLPVAAKHIASAMSFDV